MPSSFAFPPLYLPVVTPTTPLVRPGLQVRQTLLTRTKKSKQALPFHGLFATADIPAYGFVGLYAGVFYEEWWSEDDELDGDPPPRSHYAVNLSGFTVVPPGEDTPRGVDPRRYPLAMMNEPPRGQTANVSIVEWSKAGEAVPGLPPTAKVLVAAVHTCRAVAAGEELYYHYGDAYDRAHYGRRPHSVGEPCPEIRRGHVPPEERPRAVLLARGVRELREGEAYLRL